LKKFFKTYNRVDPFFASADYRSEIATVRLKGWKDECSFDHDNLSGIHFLIVIYMQLCP